MTGFTLTPEQTAIITYCTPLPPTNVCIEATAGSSKTTTGALYFKAMHTPFMLEYLRAPRACAVAFGTRNADDFKKKLPEFVNSSTFHSLCFSRLRAGRTKWTVEPNKWITVAKAMKVYTADSCPDFGRAMSLIKMAGWPIINPGKDTIRSIIIAHGLDCGQDLPASVDLLARAIKVSDDLAVKGIIDFDDQIRLVAFHSHFYSAPVNWPALDILFIDEAQDLDPTQHMIVADILQATGAKLIMVGDPRQACYGFRGALSDSFHILSQAHDCKQFPLSVSFRCAKSIVRTAQAIIGPSIQPWELSPEGTVRNSSKFNETLPFIKDGTAILCRNTAPLIPVFYKLLRRHRHAIILGRDFGKTLTNLITRIAGKNELTHENFLDRLERWRYAERASALKQDLFQKAEVVNEKALILHTFSVEIMLDGPFSITALKTAITKCFNNDIAPIVLSTIHKAKGFEWDSVIFLEPDLIPSRWAKTEEQLLQESNLSYIAVTRAKTDLLYLQPSE